MDLKRIDNLWKFLSIKNNLHLRHLVGDSVTYMIGKGSQKMTHRFNPRFLSDSILILEDVNFQSKLICKQYHAPKKQFGIKQASMSPASSVVFFPKELLKLSLKYDLKIHKDRYDHYAIAISPFNPKNIYDILNAVNLMSKSLWIKNFFAEGIRN
ncbi:hypothetical protein ACFOUP_06755 [Belliella kenyensis]|uniref:Uncharacterized protein n=1 Tax=Belliella kenyensis TaxID=1472724 RepID=A0ABV8EL50_9BACT|nr:hypothetical protein [Belliella kenyensis]MCH7401239.1 hypothetical protein [Belliella kenyensis]MDN3602685.1 hypothetical protein [Belliella kenyensis]